MTANRNTINNPACVFSIYESIGWFILCVFSIGVIWHKDIGTHLFVPGMLCQIWMPYRGLEAASFE